MALESTILAHGLPAPGNRTAADAIEAAVRADGAVPATVAVLDGRARVGLSAAELDRVCAGGLAKLSARDLGVGGGPAPRRGDDGGGDGRSGARRRHPAVRHRRPRRGAPRRPRAWDVSADLGALARTRVLVVCSGVKSILDVPATLEVLETASVPVLDIAPRFPGFYRRDAGLPVPWRVDAPAEVAAAWRAHVTLGGGAGMVLAQPVPAADELARALHDRLLAEGLALVAEARCHRQGGDARAARPLPRRAAAARAWPPTARWCVANAALAAQVAVALAG